MKKIFRTILTGLSTVVAPLAGASQIADPIIDTVLKMLSGIGALTTVASGLPRPWIRPVFKAVGVLISTFANARWKGWDKKGEIDVLAGLDGLKEGLLEHQAPASETLR